MNILLKNRFITIASLFILLTSCNRETLFQSDFNASAIGAVPAHVQKTGTLDIDGPQDHVQVIAAPAGSGDKWVKVSRTPGQQSVTGIICHNSKFIGNGSYHFSSAMFIPSGGSGPATIQFEAFAQQASFFHIDFMPNGQLRLDDDASTSFGHFPHDSVFIVSVGLDINSNQPKVTIGLAGAGTEGTKDYNILPAFKNVAMQFGATRLWIGFPWTGSFDVTDIVVTHDL